MLRWSETRGNERDNEMALQPAEVRMISWMCGVRSRDKLLTWISSIATFSERVVRRVVIVFEYTANYTS